MSGWVSSTGWNINLASPGPIGNTTPSSGSFTTLNASSNITLSGGTANGVIYLNGSKVATSGSALTYSGGSLTNTVPSNASLQLGLSVTNATNADFNVRIANSLTDLQVSSATPLSFTLGSAEQMRLTLTGLQITDVVSTGGYTVATLPASVPTGSRAYVTDALTPVVLTTVAGGGAVVVPVFYNGSAWIVG